MAGPRDARFRLRLPDLDLSGRGAEVRAPRRAGQRIFVQAASRLVGVTGLDKAWLAALLVCRVKELAEEWYLSRGSPHSHAQSCCV